MLKGTFFLAGAYGVGKSTIGMKLSAKTSIPFFSAGNLISEINGEEYGANKVVKNKDLNQSILIERVCELHRKHHKIILAGHFCIFGKENAIETLPDFVFDRLSLVKIILLEANPCVISEFLQQRDNKVYSADILKDLAKREKKQALKIAQRLNCPFSEYQMSFTDTDLTALLKLMEDET